MTYLTASDYVLRYGAVETTRVTDETKSGAYDPNKLAKAIQDASDFADSYLAVKYVVPIAGTPPQMLQGIIAALARELLFKTKPTDEVLRNADLARAQLKDLAAGRATIPIASDGTVTEETPSGGAVTSGDGRPRIFTGRRLCDFTDLSGRSGSYGNQPSFCPGDNW